MARRQAESGSLAGATPTWDSTHLIGAHIAAEDVLRLLRLQHKLLHLRLQP